MFKGFNIYWHGGHLGHVTWTIWTNCRSPIPWNLASIGPVVSEEKMFENVDIDTHIPTYGRWRPAYPISSPLSLRLRWANKCPYKPLVTVTSWENLSSGFPTKQDSNRSAQLQRLGFGYNKYKYYYLGSEQQRRWSGWSAPLLCEYGINRFSHYVAQISHDTRKGYLVLFAVCVPSNVHAQLSSGVRSLALCLKLPLIAFITWATSEGSDAHGFLNINIC